MITRNNFGPEYVSVYTKTLSAEAYQAEGRFLPEEQTLGIAKEFDDDDSSSNNTFSETSVYCHRACTALLPKR
jgi:hypothetical protein